MNCPNCGVEMTGLNLDSHLRTPIQIDLCTACQAFWFDRYESLQLSPRSLLRLMKLIGEQSAAAPPFSQNLKCPRCRSVLRFTNDMQRNTRFSYWRCTAEHGRYIRFFEFLREKDFIRPLSAEQLQELRRNVQSLNCSGCGAPIDLTVASKCSHCGSPVSMLDMNQPRALLARLQQAADDQNTVDPTLPLQLARARREVETSFAELGAGHTVWADASSSGLVEAGLAAVARWLSTSGF